jgi:integrase
MILLAYRHAMRASELCDLKLADVNLRDMTVTVERKKGSRRTVQPIERMKGQPLLDEVKAIKSWLEDRHDNSPYFFVSRKGGRLDRTAIWRAVKAVSADAGLPEVWPHTLKHSRASLLLQGGATVTEVQNRCGHTALSSTMRYLHTDDATSEKAARKAEANIF